MNQTDPKWPHKLQISRSWRNASLYINYSYYHLSDYTHLVNYISAISASLINVLTRSVPVMLGGVRRKFRKEPINLTNSSFAGAVPIYFLLLRIKEVTKQEIDCRVHNLYGWLSRLYHIALLVQVLESIIIYFFLHLKWHYDSNNCDIVEINTLRDIRLQISPVQTSVLLIQELVL